MNSLQDFFELLASAFRYKRMSTINHKKLFLRSLTTLVHRAVKSNMGHAKSMGIAMVLFDSKSCVVVKSNVRPEASAR